MTVVTNIDPIEKILRKRGLQVNGPVQSFFTNECAKFMDKYVPMQSGILKNTRVVGKNYVMYIMPYARYHYYGKLMVGRAPKKLTDIDMKYHGAPNRGPFWDKRMWAENGSRITEATARYAGGRAGR